MKLEVREATWADCHEVTTFLAAIASENLDTITKRPSWTLDLAREWLKPKLDDEHSFVLVAIDGASIVGMLDVTGGAREHDRHLATLGITVAQSHRGRGVGRQLLDEAISRARAWPRVCRLELQCAAWNEPAIRLYRSVGFEVEAVRRKGINLRGTPEDDLSMSLVW